MRTLPLLYGKTLLALLLTLGAAHADTVDHWPEAPKLIELDTPYGTLTVSKSDYIYESRLQLDGSPIEPEISGMLNILYAFDMPGRQAALVSISKGNDACPIAYQWVILQSDSYKVSPELGSCSEHIRVSADTKSFALQTPSKELPGVVDTYVYDGKTVIKK